MLAGAWSRDDGNGSAVRSVRALLWDLALRLEDGGIPAAERRLAEARQRLADALRSGASEADIERLMDTLKDALDEFLAALATELSRRPEVGVPPLPFGQTLRPESLRGLLDRARDLSRAGARDEARALIGDLQRALDRLRLGLRQGPASDQLRAAQSLMQDLRSLEARQRALLDETFQHLREQQDSSGAVRGVAVMPTIRRARLLSATCAAISATSPKNCKHFLAAFLRHSDWPIRPCGAPRNPCPVTACRRQ